MGNSNPDMRSRIQIFADENNIDLDAVLKDIEADHANRAALKPLKPVTLPERRASGLRVNYYLVKIDHPQREEQPPYQAECEDIMEALGLTPDEANIFKEIWRTANARTHGNGKIGHTALYGAEKIVHYSGRILRRLKRIYEKEEQDKQQAQQRSM
jgi:hypothetical protein